MQLPEHCTLCPRRCGANRAAGRTGYCGAGDTLLAARAALHHWEEPCLSGDPNAATGSGTVFFTGCTLQCCYCQNYKISQQGLGKPLTAERLAEIFYGIAAKRRQKPEPCYRNAMAAVGGRRRWMPPAAMG